MAAEYTDLYRVREYLSLASYETGDDRTLLSFIREASRAIDRFTQRRFYPRLEVRRYDYERARYLRLDDDLLEVRSLTTQNGACTIASSVYWLSGGSNWNYSPYNEIVLDETAASMFSFSGTPRRANAVSGLWGFHTDWPSAFRNTGTSLPASMSADTSVLNLAGAGSFGAGASDTEFNYPRVSVGATLKIGDEYIRILDGGSTATLTLVERGAHGTVAASHASGASIAKFLPEPEIETAARRLAAWKYAAKDAPFQAKIAFPALGEISIPQAWPPDVLDSLMRFKRYRLGLV